MNQDLINDIYECATKMNYEKALETISTKYTKSEKIVKIADKLIDAYEDTKDLNKEECGEVFKLLVAYIYIDNYKG